MTSYLRTINHSPDLLISFGSLEKEEIFLIMLWLLGEHRDPNIEYLRENLQDEMIN